MLWRYEYDELRVLGLHGVEMIYWACFGPQCFRRKILVLCPTKQP